MSDAITVFESVKPARLGKRYTENQDGTLTKTPAANLTQGTAKLLMAPDARTLANILNTATERDNVALMAGAFIQHPDDGPINVVPRAWLKEKLGGDATGTGVHSIDGKPYAARLSVNVQQSRWLLLDADSPKGCPSDWRQMDISQRLAVLEKVVPGISTCERVEVLASSARVAPDGVPSHAWIRLADPTDLPRFKQALKAQSMRADVGYFHPAGDWRTLVDLAPFDNGRLVFVSKPDASQAPSLTVRPATPQIVNPDGGMLDTSVCPLPTPEQAAEIAQKTGRRVRIRTGKDGRTYFDDGTALRPDVAVTVKGETRALRDWLKEIPPGGKLRCEAIFRESESEAAFLVRKDFSLVAYDSGSGTCWTMPLRADGAPVEWLHHLPPYAEMVGEVEKANRLASDSLGEYEPAPFVRMTERGLYAARLRSAKVLNEKGKPVLVKLLELSRVCGLAAVECLSRDSSGGEWQRQLEYFDNDWHHRVIGIPETLTHTNPQLVAQLLAEQGFSIAVTDSARLAFVQWLAEQKPNQRQRIVHKTGWHGDAFALPDGTVLGAKAINERLVLAGADPHSVARAGTARVWAQNLGTCLPDNPLLAFAVGVGLCAPLAALVKRPAPAIGFVGKSSGGKTTALKVAASLWGDPASFVGTWRATANGLESVASMRNGLVLCLDELQQISGRELSSALYMLSDGAGKARSRRDGTARVRQTWAIAILSSGELKAAEKLRAANERSFTGQAVRLAELPAAERYGLFTSTAGFASPLELVNHIETTLRAQFGTVGPAFIEHLCANRQAITARVDAHLTALASDATPYAGKPDLLPHARRVLERFVLAGISLGVAGEAGLLPDMDEAAGLAIVRYVFNLWIGEADGGTVEQKDGVALVQTALVTYGGTNRFAPLGLKAIGRVSGAELDEAEALGTNNSAAFLGWKEIDPDDGLPTFYLKGATLVELTKSVNLPLRELAEALERAGLLILAKDGSRTTVKHIGKQVQARVYALRPKDASV